MKKDWPLVPLAEVLKPISRPESVDPEKTYRILGAHWYAGGLYVKDTLSGSEIRADKVFRVEKGDFVYNRLFAWKGSFAVATETNARCYVSNEFPCFEIIKERAAARFLWRYFSRVSAWEEALGLSTGGTPTSRNRLKEEKFLAMEIPLPPLPEQRRIVARIEELATKINEARDFRQRSAQEGKALKDVAARPLFGEPNCEVGEVADVTKLAGFEYTKYLAGTPSGDVVLLRAGNVRDSGLDLFNASTIPTDISDRLPRSQLHTGDVVMTFIGANIGDVTFVSPVHPRLHCGPNVAKLTPKPIIDHRYLTAALQAHIVQDQIREITKLTAQPSLSMKTIRKLKLPVPDLDKQYRIVAEVNALQFRVDALKKLQSETAAELEALLPSILDKAFKAEL